MGVTPTESHDDGGQRSYPGGAPPPDEAPTSQLLSGAVGDRCTNCGAPLASDQRYCIQCGERRGKSRFSPASMTSQPVQTTTTTASRGSDPSPRRQPSGATVVAGIATLVLALGVGVEIGRIANNSNNSNAKAPAAQVITVNGGGGASSAQTTTAAGGGANAAAKHHHAAPPPKTEAKKAQQAAKAVKPTQQAVQKASHAASSVLGGGGGQQNNTVTSGASCASGSAGCEGGHFTGNFFGQ
jgi:hypothetical protein